MRLRALTRAHADGVYHRVLGAIRLPPGSVGRCTPVVDIAHVGYVTVQLGETVELDLDTWVAGASPRARARLPRSISVAVTKGKFDGQGYTIDFEGARVLGQFIVWPNGHADGLALSRDATEPRVLNSVCTNRVELDIAFDAVLGVVMEIELR
jgi:hypothetical protein